MFICSVKLYNGIMSNIYVVEFLFVFVFVNAKGTNIKKVSVDVGKNLTVNCPLNQADVMWIREGRDENMKMHTLQNGSLYLEKVDQNISAIYSCLRQNDVIGEKGSINITVRTPPPPLLVTIKPSTILVVIFWKVNGTGGYPIINFTAQYRLAFSNQNWIPISPNHITPNSRQLEVYNLLPNTTYEFRIWATNQLGRSPAVSVLGTTKGSYTEQELARHFLQGADKFNTTWWAVAVGIVMGTFIVLGMGIGILLYQECREPDAEDEQEIIELVPNIILNPGFDGGEGTSMNEASSSYPSSSATAVIIRKQDDNAIIRFNKPVGRPRNV